MPHHHDMEHLALELSGEDGKPYTETFTGKLIVESNSGPHHGTKLYVDSAGRFIAYKVAERKRRIFDRELDNDEIESYCDSDEEFLAAMLKLGRRGDFSS